MSITRLSTREDLERCLAESADAPVFVLKHSTTWPISAGARSEFLRFAAAHPAVRCAEVHVREDRPLSLAVAEATGVEHQSPQVICLRGGRASWHASHHAITARALDEQRRGGG